MTEAPKRDDASDMQATLDYANARHLRMVKELADAEAEVARLREALRQAGNKIMAEALGDTVFGELAAENARLREAEFIAASAVWRACALLLRAGTPADEVARIAEENGRELVARAKAQLSPSVPAMSAQSANGNVNENKALPTDLQSGA